MKRYLIVLLLIIMPCILHGQVILQDSGKHYNERAAIALGAGLQSGLTLSVNQKILNSIFAYLAAGFLVDRYTLNFGGGINLGDNSYSNLCIRYTITSHPQLSLVFTEEKSISLFYQSFYFNSSRSPFFWGLGFIYIFGHHDIGGNVWPFAEIGIRLATF